MSQRPRMRDLWRIVSVLLLALWLPAGEHCALEAAGFIAKTCADDGGPADDSCASDGCASLESAPFRSSQHVVQVAPPAADDCLCLISLSLAAPEWEPEPGPSTAVLDRPQDWVPIWHFVRRAAPPSRAPTALLA